MCQKSPETASTSNKRRWRRRLVWFENYLLVNSPGMRIIKTGIALFMSLLITQVYASPDHIQASIAAIVCLGQSMQHTKEASLNRVIGTLIAGGLAFGFMHLTTRVLTLQPDTPIYFFWVTVFTIFLMWLMVRLKKPGAVVISSIVFVIITTMFTNGDYLTRAVTRVMDTLVGVVVALLVNWFPPLNRLGERWAMVQRHAAEQVKTLDEHPSDHIHPATHGLSESEAEASNCSPKAK